MIQNFTLLYFINYIDEIIPRKDVERNFQKRKRRETNDPSEFFDGLSFEKWRIPVDFFLASSAVAAIRDTGEDEGGKGGQGHQGVELAF